MILNPVSRTLTPSFSKSWIEFSYWSKWKLGGWSAVQFFLKDASYVVNMKSYRRLIDNWSTLKNFSTYSQSLQSPCFCKELINADFRLLSLCCYLRCDYFFIFYNYRNIILCILMISLPGTDLAGLIFWRGCRDFRNKRTSQVLWKCLWSEISTCYFTMS